MTDVPLRAETIAKLRPIIDRLVPGMEIEGVQIVKEGPDLTWEEVFAANGLVVFIAVPAGRHEGLTTCPVLRLIFDNGYIVAFVFERAADALHFNVLYLGGSRA